MKYDDAINVFKAILAAVKDPTIITDKLGITEIFQFPNGSPSQKNIYTDQENIAEQTIDDIPNEANTSYIVNDDYYNKPNYTSSNPQGVIDSIAQELTSARLQQAIILSEIVGKPRSKTRRKRRF